MFNQIIPDTYLQREFSANLVHAGWHYIWFPWKLEKVGIFSIILCQVYWVLIDINSSEYISKNLIPFMRVVGFCLFFPKREILIMHLIYLIKLFQITGPRCNLISYLGIHSVYSEKIPGYRIYHYCNILPFDQLKCYVYVNQNWKWNSSCGTASSWAAQYMGYGGL